MAGDTNPIRTFTVYDIELDKRIVLKVRRWSTKKFYTLFAAMGSLFAEVARSLASKLPKSEEGKKQDVAEMIATILEVFSKSTSDLEPQLNMVILESVFSPPAEFNVGNIDPADYMGLLTLIVDMNVNERTSENFRGLLRSFGAAFAKKIPAIQEAQEENMKS